MKNIIVVDDEEEIAEMITEFLEIEGYQATGFSCPKKALNHMKNNKTNILITDNRMPHMTGIELITLAFKINKNIKPIMITASPLDVPAKIPVIAKPFSFANFKTKLQELI